MEPKEYKITAPWGFMAAKVWGDDNNPPILMVHGYMDNAATFDRLVPHLPSEFYYICIDLPGHGKSSNFPPYIPIHFIYYLTALRVVFDHFGRKNYIIVAHSFGAMLSIMFTQVYPDYISKLVMIDGIYYPPIYPAVAQKMIWYQHLGYARYIKAEMEGGRSKGGTYEELLKKLLDNRFFGEISTDAMKLIMERMLVPLDDGKYKLSLDNRMKTIHSPFIDYQWILETFEKCPVKCPTLVILYDVIDSYKVIFSELIRNFLKNPLFTLKFITGHHMLHADAPDIVAPILAKFLLKEFSKL